MRWAGQLAAVVAASAAMAAGAAASAAIGAAPATAANGVAVSWPARIEAVSEHDGSRFKRVVATCPGGRVFGTGALVGGGGGAVLTAIEPDPALTQVTVEAMARSGYQGDWSLAAIAVCSPPFGQVDRIVGGPDSPTTASVACPGDDRLTGIGFRMLGPVDATHLVALQPSATMQQARVRTGGSVRPAALLAYGICQGAAASNRVDASVPVDGVWPKVANAGASTCADVFGVGGAVDAEDGFLTGLVPHPDQRRAWVRADRVPPSAMAVAAAGLASGEDGDGDEDEEDSVTAYTIEIGTPYC